MGVQPTVTVHEVTGSSPTYSSAITSRSWDYVVIPGSGSPDNVTPAKCFVYKFTNNAGSELKLYMSTGDGHGLKHPFYVTSTYTDPSTINSTTIQSWALMPTILPTTKNINDCSSGSYTQFCYDAIITPSTATSDNNVQFVYRLSYFWV